MNPRGVVVVDSAVDSRHQFPEHCASVRIAQIDLELAVEALLVSILPRTTGMRTRDENTKAGKYRDECTRVVLSAVVRMEDCRMRMIEECTGGRLYRDLCSFAERHGNTDNLTGIHIDHRGDVDPLPFEPHLGEISSPYVVLVLRYRRGQEVSVEVNIPWFSVLFRSSSAPCFDAKLPHHALRALLVDPQMLCDPPVSIRGMGTQCFFNASLQEPVGLFLL